MHQQTPLSSVLIRPEIQEALQNNTAIVALESNVIAHGLPYPMNLETINRMELEIRAAGAVPATTAIKDGKILVGLDDAEKRFFATTPDLPKASSRDIAMLLATGQAAVTTVAASLVAADLAGIRFFASAGIGGVHRGASENLDISSDLIQLTRSRVVAVTAGVKKILDIGLTLEFLETHCVPCVTYRYDDFPAFYVRSSGFRSPCRMDDLSQIAQAIIQNDLVGHAGFLVAAPIAEEDAIDSSLIEDTIQAATKKAAKDNITGKDLTKYIMRAVNTAVHGDADQANAAILIANARFAAELSVNYADMVQGQTKGGDAP